MRVGLTMRVVHPQGYQEPRDAISHDWIRVLEEMGWSPRLIPNRLSDVAGAVDGIDALILTGGNDLTAELSGLDAGEVRDTAPERDQQEARLLQEAARRGLPTIGICRGLQMINCHYGGRLVRVDSMAHVATRHRVRITDEPWRSLFGPASEVNSFHGCGVAANGLGTDLVAFATGEDGTVEGFYHRHLPLLAIMWHPERSVPLAAADRALLQRFFNEGSFWNHAN